MRKKVKIIYYVILLIAVFLNVAKNLAATHKLDGIGGILVSRNFFLMMSIAVYYYLFKIIDIPVFFKFIKNEVYNYINKKHENIIDYSKESPNITEAEFQEKKYNLFYEILLQPIGIVGGVFLAFAFYNLTSIFWGGITAIISTILFLAVSGLVLYLYQKLEMILYKKVIQ